ncbi:MAG: 4-diphosphocytidyl-2C-methyl-D-erythritol synthase [Marmoricola sp.]|nr:4-diphosphocytidyl-2C-methyl-D-erythritol synthase [Marmoricola sp.]
MSLPRTALVILAAGSGARVGAEINKVLLPLEGLPILVHSIRTAMQVDGVHRIVLVIRAEDREAVAAAVAPHLGSHDVWVVDGGLERHDSEWQALTALRADIEAGEIQVVAIHDAARPLATADLFRQIIDTAAERGAAIPVVATGQLTRRDGAAPPASGLVAVQTPQGFRAAELLDAYTRANADGFTGTDTASCLERYVDLPIVGVPSTPANLKVTFPEDVALAESLLRPTRH